MKGEHPCATSIKSLKLHDPKSQNNSLQTILAQLDGFLSRLSNGTENGSTTSPVLNLTINITVNAPYASGGGAIASIGPVKTEHTNNTIKDRRYLD